MAKFKNVKTGLIEETDNDFVIAQMRKYPGSYEEIKAKTKGEKEKAEAGENSSSKE